jgi:1,4-alpha-glucan branching enzyme
MKTLSQTKNSSITVRKRNTSRVHFDYFDSHAKSVCVAGTFNGWRPGATPMGASPDGHWQKDIALPAGTYEYALIVDGVWKPDPQCEEKAKNPFGGFNSVLRVRACDDTHDH